jgi:hypothetical protein
MVGAKKYALMKSEKEQNIMLKNEVVELKNEIVQLNQRLQLIRAEIKGFSNCNPQTQKE